MDRDRMAVCCTCKINWKLTGLKGYFPGNLVESTWEDESTIDDYVASGLISLFKRNICNNLQKKKNSRVTKNEVLYSFRNLTIIIFLEKPGA